MVHHRDREKRERERGRERELPEGRDRGDGITRLEIGKRGGSRDSIHPAVVERERERERES